jgi:hypothetical protein
MGKYELSNNLIECSICYEQKNKNVKLECGHEICYDCWYFITKNNFGHGECPLCRGYSGWAMKNNDENSEDEEEEDS